MSVKTSVHALIKNDENEILLTQRTDIPLWVMPGGTVELGESLVDALVREVHEEIGYEVGEFQQVMKTKLGSSEKYVYTAKIIGGFIKLDLKEVRSIRWVKAEKLPAPMSLFEKNRVIKILNVQGRFIDEELKIDKKQELLNLAKNPVAFFWVLFSYVSNRIHGGSFKV